MPGRIPNTLLALVLLALALRLTFAIVVLGLNAPLRGDEPDYHMIAANIAAGNEYVKHVGIPTALRPPLYPTVLAGIYTIFGSEVPVARIFQVFLGTLLVPLTYMLARRFVSRALSMVAAAIVTLNPFLIFISAYVMTENLYALLVLLVMIALTDAMRAGFASGGRLVLAGILVGLCALTRPHGLLFAVVAAPTIVFLGTRRWRRRLLGAGLFVLSVAVVLVPWGLRNEARMGRLILLSTSGGITFFACNNQLALDEPAFHGGSVVPWTDAPNHDRIKALGEVDYDREAGRIGLEFLRNHPEAVPRLMAWKFLRFWRFRSDVGFSGVKSGFWWDKEKPLGALASALDVGFIYNIVVIPFFLLGLLLTLRRLREMVFLHANILVHTSMALMFYGSLRARIPIEPVLAIWAAVGLAWLLGRITRRPVAHDGP